MEIQQQQQQQQQLQLQLQRRAAVILKHLIFSSSLNFVTPISSSVCTSNKHDSLLDPKLLSDIIDYDMQDYRQQLYEFLKDPIFIPRYELSMQEYRELTLQRLKKVLDAKLISINDYKNNMRKYLAFHDVMRMTDLSLAVKLAVHMTLFGGTILNLGTEYHHQKWLPGIDNFECAGCFGMTELGHGSNVQGIETEAIYDHSRREFIINTPHDRAQKYWIGNAACHGKFCAVFAKLIVKGKNEGIHVFIVPIRNGDGSVAENVRIADNGSKMGMQGVDNGRIWFLNKRIPKENLLNRYGDITPEGEYVSPIHDPIKRFAVMIAPLVLGRLHISTLSNRSALIGLKIAIRYGHQRRQFKPEGALEEIPIINYLTHQRRLYPPLAASFAYHFALKLWREKFLKPNKTPEDEKEIHLLAAGLKPMITWNKSHVLQMCRECCGGQGFSMYNRIAAMKNDSEIDTTYEGDNTVLLQQVSKALVREFSFKGSGSEFSVDSAPLFDSHDLMFLESKEFLLSALKWRVTHLLTRLYLKLNSATTKTGVWEDNLDLVLAVAKAHVERMVLENFYNDCESAHENIRFVLLLLAKMFGVWRIVEDLGYFVSFGALTSRQGQIFHSVLLNKLCQELHPFSLSLANGIPIPDHLLRAPIAYDYIERNAYGRDLLQL